MSEFVKFRDAVSRQMDAMVVDGGLFETSADRDQLWELYLSSFPEGTNPVFRERREHDCSACRTFVKNLGGVVSVRGNKLVSVWDAKDVEYPYNVVCAALSEYVRDCAIANVLLSRERHVGVACSREMSVDGEVVSWTHFNYVLPAAYASSQDSESVESAKGTLRDTRNVFKRSLDELTIDAGNTVLDLIGQGSLYRGEEFKVAVSTFLHEKALYECVPLEDREAWCWQAFRNSRMGRIRNTALGTLLVDLSSGVDIDNAVTRFEKVMAPASYKRPKAVFTRAMVSQAQEKVKELGLEDSLARRQAVLDDMSANDVLFLNRDASKAVGGNALDALMGSAAVNSRSFGKVEEISMEEFLEKVVPSAASIELLVENSHRNNLVSLVAPVHKQAPSMLKWDNNFSWSYRGSVADSMKANVEKAGGNVGGVLRFSIQWNDNGDTQDDLDAHCEEPGGNHISFRNKGCVHASSGKLDVDIIRPDRGQVAVENIAWSHKERMPEGRYVVYVHCYTCRGGKAGFTAELEFDGVVHSYACARPLKHGETVVVAEFNYSRAKGINIVKSLEGSSSVQNVWGIKTNTFVGVSAAMLSPNHWDGAGGVGNKHYLFFLNGCVPEEAPRGFYNEFLRESLAPHRRVFEALGGRMAVQEAEGALAGLGFSSTQRSEIVVRVGGSFTRCVRVKV